MKREGYIKQFNSPEKIQVFSQGGIIVQARY